jgi:hypothetical protein
MNVLIRCSFASYDLRSVKLSELQKSKEEKKESLDDGDSREGWNTTQRTWIEFASMLCNQACSILQYHDREENMCKFHLPWKK